MMIGLGWAAMDENVSFGQQPLNRAAGNLGKLAAQEDIQAPAGKRLAYGQRGWRHGAQWSARAPSGTATVRSGALRPSSSCFQETKINRPTPTQIALSAMLKAGKPISRP